MSLVLKNATASQFPPQGWPFTDPRTGMKFNGWEGSPPMQAVKIAAHRRANPHKWPDGEGQDTNGIVQELYAQKFASMPWLFVGQPDKDPTYRPNREATSVTISGEKCSCGATEFKPVYCKTCSGKRITGYTCASCGKEK